MALARVVGILLAFQPAKSRPGPSVTIGPGSGAQSRYASWSEATGGIRLGLVRGARLIIGDALVVQTEGGPGTLLLEPNAAPVAGVTRFMLTFHEGEKNVGTLDLTRADASLAIRLHEPSQCFQASLDIEAEDGALDEAICGLGLLATIIPG